MYSVCTKVLILISFITIGCVLQSRMHESSLVLMSERESVCVCVCCMCVVRVCVCLLYVCGTCVCVSSTMLQIDVQCTCINAMKKGRITNPFNFDHFRYVILPLSFNHWHRPIVFGLESSPRQRYKQEENSVPCVISLSSSQDLNWEAHVPTKPGFLAEALFLLADKSGSVTHVRAGEY